MTTRRARRLNTFGSGKVIRLREWGTGQLHELPRATARAYLVGSSAECAMQLTGDGIHPIHAQLTLDSGRWSIRCIGVDYGLQKDGTVLDEFTLEPGMEIGIGSTTLIAESTRSIALREYCARLLGWSCAPSVIDQALRSIRLATARRAPLVLHGDGAIDLVGVAYSLHRRILGSDAPFVYCGPRGSRNPAFARYFTHELRGEVALQAAACGTLCVRQSQLPADIEALMARLREPQACVWLIVCLDWADPGSLVMGPSPIYVPDLHGRSSEVPSIVLEYVGDALAALRAPVACFEDDDLWWVVEHAASSLVEIEQATARIVAIKISSSLNEAAQRLGITTSSLSRWFARRLEPPYLYPRVRFSVASAGQSLSKVPAAPSDDQLAPLDDDPGARATGGVNG